MLLPGKKHGGQNVHAKSNSPFHVLEILFLQRIHTLLLHVRLFFTAASVSSYALIVSSLALSTVNVGLDLELIWIF